MNKDPFTVKIVPGRLFQRAELYTCTGAGVNMDNADDWLLGKCVVMVAVLLTIESSRN